MLKSVMSIHDWLEQAQNHADDPRWLTEHEDTLYTVVKGGLRRDHEFHDAVELLMTVVPHYALVLYHPQRWSPLLFEALVQAQDFRDSEMQIRILTQMGEAYITRGKNDAAHEAFTIAIERAGEGHLKEMMLAAYIGLIRMQSASMGDEYDPNLLARATALSLEIDDLGLKAFLHQSLSLAYIYRRETVDAIEHGQIAYVYWHYLGHELELAKTLYLLSAAYRFAWRLKRAEDLLQIAARSFENTAYNRQFAILAYEAGAQYVQSKDYDTAIQWLLIALREAVTIDVTHLIASSYHALGIAQTGLGYYEEAEANLKQAITKWEKLNNYYELANAHQAMGNLENKRRQPENALTWLQKALELGMHTPPSYQRTWLENHIRETIDEIPW